MPNYLTTLATGQQGRYTIKHLLASGASVHAVVRDPASEAARKLQDLDPEKVTLFQGTLTDLSVFRTAATGCTGIFLNLPDPEASDTDAGSRYRMAADILRVAHEAGVQHVVASTAMSTGSPEKWDNETSAHIGMRTYMLAKSQIEEATRTAGLSWTILRPSWLFSNYLLPASKLIYPELASKGELAHALDPGTTMAHVDEEDVGRYAAAALQDPEKFGSRIIELGNDSLTMEAVSSAMASISRKSVSTRKRTAEEIENMRKGVAPMPMSLPFELWTNQFEMKADRAISGEDFGIPLTSLEEYFNKRKDELLLSLPPKD